MPGDYRIIDFRLNDLSLKLRTDGRVFLPTLTTQIVAANLVIEPGAEVLDMGCGIGPLGIYAARKGARLVMSLDVMLEACALAKENAALNGVSDRVHAITSDLFGAIKPRPFDVVIDDLSGIADEVARMSPWYPTSIPTGGPDGTTPVLGMLQDVGQFLKPGGRLYLPVSSLSSHRKIVSRAEELFGRNLRLIVDKMIPFCPELYQEIGVLERLRGQGIIDFITKKSRCLWNLKVFVGTYA